MGTETVFRAFNRLRKKRQLYSALITYNCSCFCTKRFVILAKCFYDTFNKICPKENCSILRIDMVMESTVSE